jgi:steroid 5-alpha reductase family enzyme
MTFIEIYFLGLLVITLLMIAVWIVSVFMKNASIVDPLWGSIYVVAAVVYFLTTEGYEPRKLIVAGLVAIWGIRLTIYLLLRSIGKGEDFRYQNFRKNYGPERYWWVSLFQVFLLQGTIAWLVSSNLLGGMYPAGRELNWLDWIGMVVWITGFVFEAGGDFQMARFKSKPENKGKLMDRGFWRYTRHPNYFGDALIWWGFASFSAANGFYLPLLGAVLMTFLLLRVSGVSMLERTLKTSKPGYEEYIKRTPAFFPWFPGKKK